MNRIQAKSFQSNNIFKRKNAFTSNNLVDVLNNYKLKKYQ